MARREYLATRWLKVMQHRFFPGASDKDPHDHPRSFVTLVLRGGYDDVSICDVCRGWGSGALGPDTCGACAGEGGTIVDTVRSPTVRFRRAEHAHITEVHDDGATTIVIMGPVRREWGFWRGGQWFEWKTYDRLFGLNWRCDE